MYLPEPLTGKVVGFRSEFEVGPGAGRQPTGGAGAAGGSHPTSIIVPSILSLEASSRKESSGWLPVGSGEIVWAPTLGRLWADSGPTLASFCRNDVRVPGGQGAGTMEGGRSANFTYSP